MRCIHRKGRDENQAVNTGNLRTLPFRSACSLNRAARHRGVRLMGRANKHESCLHQHVGLVFAVSAAGSGSAPGLRCPTWIHPLTRFSGASADGSRHCKPASQLRAGKNAAKLWDAENLALKRHNYRVRLTERQQNAQAGAKTRLRQQSYIYVSERRLNKHKPDGPKGLKLKPLLFFSPQTSRPSNICRNRMTGGK